MQAESNRQDAGICDSHQESRLFPVSGSVRFTKVVGPVGSGKTSFLIEKAKEFIEQGIAPSRVCLVAMTPSAIDAVNERLNGSALADMSVMTPLSLCQALLSRGDVRAFTGRVPRVVTLAERQLLLDDLRGELGGTVASPATLRRVEQSLARCDDSMLDDAARLLKRAIVERMRENEVMLRAELSSRLADCLEASVEVREACSFEVMLIDDYSDLSFATQRVCNLLARMCLIVAGNPHQTVSAFDVCANPLGFLAFESDHMGCEVIDLAHNMPRTQAMCVSDVLSGFDVPDRVDEGSSLEGEMCTVVKWRNPEEEFRGIADIVSHRIAREPDMDLRDIYIAVPNELWGQGVTRCLGAYRIRASTVSSEDVLEGVVGLAQHSGMLISYARLLLACNPENALARHLWCALDGGSDGLERALADAESLRRRTSFGLVKEVAREGGPSFTALCGEIEGDEDVYELFRRVASAVNERHFATDSHHIRVGPYEQIAGLKAKLVVLSGMVEGLMPAGLSLGWKSENDEARRKRNASILARGRCMVVDAAGKAQERLVVSYPQAMDVATAAKLRIEVRRERRVRGKILATLVPSPYLFEAGGVLPGAVSGEQFEGLEMCC